MIRVGFICGNTSDATSLYRAVGPFQQMQKSCPYIKFIEIKHVCWTELGTVDAVFLQRPFHKSHIEVILKIKKLNIPVWLDFDDDFLSIPIDNPAHETYSSPEIKKNLFACIGLSDVVTFSTQTLLDKYKDECKDLANPPKFIVVPNAFNDHLFKRLDKTKKVKDDIIMWRGSPTHMGDLLEVKDDIKIIADTFPDYGWLFIGQNPWMLKESIEQHKMKYLPGKDPIDYMSFLNFITPDVFIVPLADGPFNRAKSNIAWQEATLAGAVTVAPRGLPEFNRPGIFNYSKEPGNTFADVMIKVLGMTPQEKSEAVQKSWEYIEQNLLLSNVNKQREKLIEELHENSLDKATHR